MEVGERKQQQVLVQILDLDVIFDNKLGFDQQQCTQISYTKHMAC
jgi:hypothetical protein